MFKWFWTIFSLGAPDHAYFNLTSVLLLLEYPEIWIKHAIRKGLTDHPG